MVLVCGTDFDHVIAGLWEGAGGAQIKKRENLGTRSGPSPAKILSKKLHTKTTTDGDWRP
jgi:hypothetical protein